MTTYNMQKSADAYIAEFRHGIEFQTGDSLAGLIHNAQANKTGLAILSKELRSGTPEVRKNIIHLLEAIALKLNPNDKTKLPIIRDRSIIKILITDGFAKDDGAKQVAELTVRQRCKPADLAAFSHIYEASLKAGDGVVLLIAAKAKTLAAKPYVDELAKDPFWHEDPDNLELIKITQAALGNRQVERQFIDAVYRADEQAPPAPQSTLYDVGNSRDGKEVAKNLRTLGLIGTKESLSVACKYLRSPLKSFAGNGERSLRHSALDAIRYNYPDERILREPLSRSEWHAAEEFCNEHIGVVFEGPTPDLPPDVIIPNFGSQ